jgi:hypothetical protein
MHIGARSFDLGVGILRPQIWKKRKGHAGVTPHGLKSSEVHSSANSSQPKEGKDHTNQHNEPDEINDTIHHTSYAFAMISQRSSVENVPSNSAVNDREFNLLGDC